MTFGARAQHTAADRHEHKKRTFQLWSEDSFRTHSMVCFLQVCLLLVVWFSGFLLETC